MSAALVLGGVVCHASIIPPQGPGQIGLSSVVLCNSLSLHDDPSFDSTATQTLKYGDRVIVMSQQDGWAKVVLGDSEDSPFGWLDADFIAIDPAWYLTEEDTDVYAWGDTSAPKVALLDEGTLLPILRDDNDWLIVSLRGAAGWIHNPDRTTSRNNPSDNSGTSQNDSGSTSGQSQEDDSSSWFTVYTRDGDTVSIHSVGGAMYEDARGRTYVKQDNDGYYYCITTDTTYAFDPGVWTGEAYGENEFPDDVDLTGEDYGENQDWTGEDYGENQDLTGEDYGENQN